MFLAEPFALVTVTFSLVPWRRWSRLSSARNFRGDSHLRSEMVTADMQTAHVNSLRKAAKQSRAKGGGGEKSGPIAHIKPSADKIILIFYES